MGVTSMSLFDPADKDQLFVSAIHPCIFSSRVIYLPILFHLSQQLAKTRDRRRGLG